MRMYVYICFPQDNGTIYYHYNEILSIAAEFYIGTDSNL